MYDNPHPSRIVVGNESPQSEVFLGLLKEASLNDKVKTFLTSSQNLIKLFSNNLLSNKDIFFNELDSFAMSQGLNEKTIDGVCSDPRIGHGYINPSLGYGGYVCQKIQSNLNLSLFYSTIFNKCSQI